MAAWLGCYNNGKRLVALLHHKVGSDVNIWPALFVYFIDIVSLY